MREKISSLEFLIKSKREEKDFTRVRKLDFPTVVNIITKSIPPQKSRQLLNFTILGINIYFSLVVFLGDVIS